MRAPIFTVSTEDAKMLDSLVLDYICTAYGSAKHRRSEPTINAADVADYIAQHGRCPASVRGVKRWTYSACYSSLQRLTRAQLLETSLALVNGQETRCYNPVGA